MARFRKKPVVIEAIYYDGTNFQEISDFTRTPFVVRDEDIGMPLSISTLEGDLLAQPGDMIIKGVKGEFYPCKADIFAATYEAVEE